MNPFTPIIESFRRNRDDLNDWHPGFGDALYGDFVEQVERASEKFERNHPSAYGPVPGEPVNPKLP